MPSKRKLEMQKRVEEKKLGISQPKRSKYADKLVERRLNGDYVPTLQHLEKHIPFHPAELIEVEDD